MLIEFVVIFISLVIALMLILAHVWFMALERLTRGQGWQTRSGWTFFMTFVFDMLIGMLAGVFIGAFLLTVYGRAICGIPETCATLLWIYGMYWWYYMPERVTEEEERAFYAEMAAKGEKPLIAPSWDATPLKDTFLIFIGKGGKRE